MTESFDWSDTTEDATDVQHQAPKELRKAYDSLKAANADLAKQVQELTAKDRRRDVESKLSARGLPAKAADLFPSSVDPSDDEVTKWIDQYGALFGAPAAETTTSPVQETTPAAKQPEENYILAGQFEQMQKISQGAVPAAPANDLEVMLSNPNLVDEVPFDEYLAALRKAGAKV